MGRRGGEITTGVVLMMTPTFFLLPCPTTNLNMLPTEYRSTDIRDIELIRPLWVLLNEYMHTKATTFRGHFEQMTFDDRKAYFEKVADAGSLNIDLALDSRSGGRYVGYCVTSLSQEKIGEIESIFVHEDYRSRGIGSDLMIRALAWLYHSGSIRNRVSVSDGNEGVWNFYKKFGFYPRMMVLEKKSD
jgi:GNAT superfamily N-acetyltransferase